MSLRARLLAASLVLLTLGLLVADVATYRALKSFLHHRVDDQLVAAERNALRAFTAKRGGNAAQISVEELRLSSPGAFARVVDHFGNTIAEIKLPGADGTITTPDIPEKAAGSSEFRTSGVEVKTVGSAEVGGPRYRLRISSLSGGQTLMVGLPLSETSATLRRLFLIELLVTISVLSGAAVLGIYLVRLGLRPLEDIETTAATITKGDLSGRVVNDDERTEVGRLGKALNTMLDAIHSSFARQQQSEAAARESEQRMRQFVADASHELRTPVAAVRAYAELYRRGADTRPEDLARLLSRIEEEAARMGVLVDDLLLLTRLDEGRPLDRAPVDVGAVAADAVEAARVVEPERVIGLTIDGSVEVEGDRDRLRQVVDNLLANVRAHTPAGSPADVRVWAEGGRALVEVADQGPGLSDDDAEHVFERFYRADAGRSRDNGGAGLGLSIVAAIVSAHGGSVSARSRPGGGAVFKIELPLLTEHSEDSVAFATMMIETKEPL